HASFFGGLNLGVVLTRADELIDVAFAIDDFRGEPMVTIVAAAGIGPFFVESLEFSDFVRLYLYDVNVEIVALCANRNRCSEADEGGCPEGFAERHVYLLRFRLLGREPVGRLYTWGEKGSIGRS